MKADQTTVSTDGGAPDNAGFALRVIPLLGEHVAQLQSALLSAFDLSGLQQFAVVRLNVNLDTIVPVAGRTLSDITSDLIAWAEEKADLGVQGLLTAVWQQNPTNPELAALKAEWAGVVFAVEPACPYPGMMPFAEGDSSRFFGRQHEIGDAVQRLRLHPFLTVIGSSGSGKSSLVFAGIVPAMRRASFFGREQLTVTTIRPGATPLTALAQALGSADTVPGALVAGAKILTAVAPLVLVIDQFEEAFTGADTAQTLEFQATVQQLIGLPNLYLLLTVRADFYPDLMNSPLWDAVRANRLEVTALRGDRLRAAIVEPALAVGVKVDPGLIERLLADAGTEPGVLPFLQETLVLLWEKVDRRTLALAAYQELAGDDSGMSGLQVAMARRADQTLADLTPDGQVLARRIFLRLVQFGEGRPDTRRQQTEVDLGAVGDDPALLAAVIAHLTTRRLLTVDNDEAGPSRKIDIAHEALIAGWPTLRAWVKERRDAEQTRRRSEAKAAEWVRLGRSDGGLLDRVQLKEADKYLGSSDGKLLGASVALTAFVAASRKAVDPGWNPRGVLGLATLAIVVAALLGAALFLLQTNLIGLAARLASLAFWAMLALGTIGSLWALRHSEPHFLKHWSQHLFTRRRWSTAFGLLVATALATWGYIGYGLVPVEQACGKVGLGRGGTQSQIAVVSENSDSFYATIFARVLNRVSHRSAEGFPLPEGMAYKCRSFLQHTVILGLASPTTPKAYFYADELDLQTGDRNQLVTAYPATGGCRGLIYTAADVAGDFNFVRFQFDEGLLATVNPPCDAVLMNEQGRQVLEAGDFAAAEQFYLNALAIEPNYVDARVNLGEALYETERPEEAVHELQQAVQQMPKSSPIVLKHLGIACYDAKDMVCAEDAYLRALALTTDAGSKASLYNNLFQVYRHTGDLEHAGETLQQQAAALAELSPRWPQDDTLFLRNKGILAYEQKEWHEALDALVAADRLQDFTLEDWVKLVFMLVADQDQSDAYRSVRRKWDEEITYYLAKTMQQLGDRDASCHYWQRYAAIPSGSIAGESERRADALRTISALNCDVH